MYDNATKVVDAAASVCTSVCVQMQKGWLYKNAFFFCTSRGEGGESFS